MKNRVLSLMAATAAAVCALVIFTGGPAANSATGRPVLDGPVGSASPAPASPSPGASPDTLLWP